MADNKSGGELDSATTVDQKTTIFVDDGIKSENDLGKQETMDDMAIRDQSIRDFMSKPLLVSIAGWTTSNLQGADIASFSLGSVLTGNTYWGNKLQGFNLIRGTAVIRVQINANPFQQGKLYLNYLPCYANNFASGDFSYGTMHRYNIACIRQLPGVELDCRESVAVLKIPYITPSSYYNVKSGDFDWGSVWLTVLSTLQTGSAGTTDVEFSIYLSFEDIELAAPSIPQGPSGKKVKAKTFKTNPSEEEISNMGNTDVSSGLSKVSTVAGSLSAVPGIGAIAGGVSWAAGVASKVAGALGWSKPASRETPHYVSRQYNHYMPNVDGADISPMLALSCSNELKTITATAPTNDDEMSFDFLKRVSTVINTTAWTSSQVVGTELISRNISPLNIGGSTVVSKSTYKYTVGWGPPVNFLGNYFKLYRGSLRLVLKIVKTDFHTGRLMITFTPAENASTSPVYNGNSQIAMRHIVDLKEGSEVCLDMPYLFGTSYLDSNQYIGKVSVQVINVLRAPETCSSEIRILEYWSAGDDFEFAVPTQSDNSYTLGTGLGSSPFYPQIGELVCAPIGGSRIPPEGTSYAETSIGEKWLSIKQLLTRPSRFKICTTIANINNWQLWPWFRNVRTSNSTTGAINEAGISMDMFSKMSQMYAFARGSMRIIVVSDSDKVFQIINFPAKSGGVSTQFASPSTTYSVTDLQSSGAVTQPDNDNGAILSADGSNRAVSVQFPFYSRCYTWLMTNALGLTQGRATSASQPSSMMALQQDDMTKFSLYRSCGDDFQLSYFIGAPTYLIKWEVV